MKGWHLGLAVFVAAVVGYFAGVKFPGMGAKLLAKTGA